MGRHEKKIFHLLRNVNQGLCKQRRLGHGQCSRRRMIDALGFIFEGQGHVHQQGNFSRNHQAKQSRRRATGTA
jgi:hypothetical protein